MILTSMLFVPYAYAQKIEGRVFDKKTNAAIADSEVSFLNKQGDELAKSKTNQNGVFEFDAKNASEIYKIVSISKGYYSADFFVKPFKDLLVVNFKVNPISDDSGVQFTVKFGVDEHGKTLSPFYDSNANSKPKIKVIGSEKGAKEVEFSLGDIESGKMPFFYYDFNSSYLNQDNKKVTNELVNFLKQSPSKKLTVNVYLDTTGDVHYNSWLTTRRANRVIDYLVSNGIEKDRLQFEIKKTSRTAQKSSREIRRIDFYIM